MCGLALPIPGQGGDRATRLVRSTIHRLGLSPLRFGALDDLHVDLPDDFAKGRLRGRTLIAAVGIELQQMDAG